MSSENLELVAGWASLVLTLLIFSYLLRDNFLYRIAVHILVGGTAAYVAIVAVDSVLYPWINVTALDENADAAVRVVGVIPFVLGLSLLLKLLPNLARVGNPGLAFLIGIGTGVALVGAVVGTLIPLVEDAGLVFEKDTVFDGLLMTLGTIGTLVYFQYLAKRRVDGTITRSRPMRLLAWIGQVFIALTFGALYAGAVLTSLSVLTGVLDDQITFLLGQI